MLLLHKNLVIWASVFFKDIILTLIGKIMYLMVIKATKFEIAISMLLEISNS